MKRDTNDLLENERKRSRDYKKFPALAAALGGGLFFLVGIRQAMKGDGWLVAIWPIYGILAGIFLYVAVQRLVLSKIFYMDMLGMMLADGKGTTRQAEKSEAKLDSLCEKLDSVEEDLDLVIAAIHYLGSESEEKWSKDKERLWKELEAALGHSQDKEKNDP